MHTLMLIRVFVCYSYVLLSRVRAEDVQCHSRGVIPGLDWRSCKATVSVAAPVRT